MIYAVRVFDEQYLSRTMADLRNQRAEMEKLKELVRAAETRRRSREAPRPSPVLDGLHRL
jgi:hypothetical protein